MDERKSHIAVMQAAMPADPLATQDLPGGRHLCPHNRRRGVHHSIRLLQSSIVAVNPHAQVEVLTEMTRGQTSDVDDRLAEKDPEGAGQEDE